MTAKKNISTNSDALNALRAVLALSGGVAGSFTTALPIGTIATDKVYQYAGVDNTTIGGIAWRNGDSALYNGATWARIPFQALVNYILKSDITTTTGKNIADPSLFVDGSNILNTGGLNASASYGTTGYIPVISGDIISGYDGATNMRTTCYFDASKVVVAGGSNTVIATFTVPAGVYFIKASYYVSGKSTFQVEKAAVPTIFEAYWKRITAIGTDSIRDVNEQFVSSSQKAILLSLPNYFENIAKWTGGLWQNKTVLNVKHPTQPVDGIIYFDHIVDAVNSIASASAIKQYEVQIWDDIIGTATADYKSTSPDYPSYCLANVKQYVTLRGMGKMKTIHAELPDGTSDTVIQWYEGIHFDGGGKIENIRVEGYNVRYPIHFERSSGVLGLNQNTISEIRNCQVEHSGCYSGCLWTAQDAFGCGTGQGLMINFINSTFRGKRHGIRIHNSTNMLFPNRFRFENCSVYGNAIAFNLDDYCSTTSNEFIFENCDIQGAINYTITSGATSKTCEANLNFRGGNNTPAYFNNGVFTFGLRIKSNTTGLTSVASVVTDASMLLGKTFSRKGNIGVSAWVNGDESVVSTGYLLQNRLGNCSSVNKTLVLNIDGTNRTVTFNADYSAMSNTAILTAINSQLSGYAVASIDHPNAYYYPEFANVVKNKINTTSTFLPAGSFVKFTGISGVRSLIAGEKPDGYLLDDLSQNEFGRIANNLIVTFGVKSSPLMPSVFAEGDKFNISAGAMVADNTNGFSEIKAISNTYVLIKL